MSKLFYLIPLWVGCEKFLIQALQTIQNKAARSFTKLGIFTPIQILLKQCGWLSVHQLLFLQTVILLFKTNQNKTPQFLHDMTSSKLNYRTRAENPVKLRTVADYQNRDLEVIQMEIYNVLEPAAARYQNYGQPGQVQGQH